MRADSIYIGNVITLDERCPRAEAIAVKDGKIIYVGSEKIARTFCGMRTKVENLTGNTIYPGFLEGHCHPLAAGKLLNEEELGEAEAVHFLKNAQRFFLQRGLTAVYDAGMELIDPECARAYAYAVASGEYFLRTYAGSIVDENCEDMKGAVENIVTMQKRYNNEYFKIIGVKACSDGADYVPDHAKLTDLYTYAAVNGLNVHVDADSDGAVRRNLDAIEEAVARTGIADNRFALADLQLVDEKDHERFSDLNVIPVTTSVKCQKSLAKYGSIMAFHTDYPVSGDVSIPKAIYNAVTKALPESGEDGKRTADESLSRYEALCAMTKNVAYMWHEENRLGSLEVGKIANMTVFDKDFLEGDLEEILEAQLVRTIVDGATVYKNRELK